MPKREPEFRNASTSRMRQIHRWLDMAQDSYGETVPADLLAATKSGVLGSCFSSSEIKPHLSKWSRWLEDGRKLDVLFSRSEVRFLVSGKTEIGAYLTGPSTPVMQVLYREGSTPFFQGLWGLTKLHALSIAPGYRNEGHGGRMLENAVNRAARSGFLLMYGSFDAVQRPQLAGFYERHGFNVLDEGSPLPLTQFTASGIPGLPPGVGERYFVRDLTA